MAWPKLLGIDPSNLPSPSTRPRWQGKYATSGRDNKPYAHDYLLTTSPAATTIHSPTIIATNNNLPTSPISVTTSVTPHSADAEQIERDVSRVTWHLLTGSQRSRNFQMQNKHRKRVNGLLRKKQRRLGDYLNLTLTMSYYDDGCNNSDSHKDKEQTLDNDDDYDGDEDRLRYYQGFHDVGSIVLSALGGVTTSGIIGGGNGGIARSNDNDTALQSIYATTSVMGLTLACQVLTRLAWSHFRDAMRPNFHNLQSALKLIVMPLIASFDSELHSHLFDCEMEPYFCLSWVITWFAHDIRDTELVKRLYDFFLVSHPLMSVYVSVAMIIHPLNRIEVLGADCDFACVHHALSNLPKNSSNVGWKYLPGANGGGNGNAGYVTGDDDDVSYDPSLQDDQSIDGDGSVLGMDGTTSLSRSSGSCCTARVPFQELIDLSISLMHKIPPRNLINLAKRYHTEITLQPLLAQSSSIALLQPPPSWALASTVESDWVLRQRMCNEMHKKLNRHQRRNRSKVVPGGSSLSTTSANSPLTIVKSNTRNACVFRPVLQQRGGSSTIHARIASGMGPDGLAEARKMRKNRRMMVRVMAIAILSIIVALAKKYYYSGEQQLPSPSVLLSRDYSQDTQSTVNVIIEDTVSNDDGLVIEKEEALIVEGIRTEVCKRSKMTYRQKAQMNRKLIFLKRMSLMYVSMTK
jgi:hypothetical protein